MDDVIITWNATNWITILLMAAVGFLALGALAQGVKAWQAKQVSA